MMRLSLFFRELAYRLINKEFFNLLPADQLALLLPEKPYLLTSNDKIMVILGTGGIN